MLKDAELAASAGQPLVHLGAMMPPNQCFKDALIYTAAIYWRLFSMTRRSYIPMHGTWSQDRR
jgi:hypothetical protein